MLRRILRISLAVLLVIVLCGAILCASLTNGFRDWNPYCWGALGGHKYGDDGICIRCGAEKLDGIGADDKPGDEQSLDEGYFLPTPDNLVSLTFIDPENYPAYNVAATAETAYELTATISPADADNQRVIWRVEFMNPDEEWAQDKKPDDYVHISPASEGSNRATLSCLQPFEAQINVLAISEDNPSFTATCLCDYVKRVVGVDLDITSDTLMFGTTYTVNATPRYGVGTIEGEYSVTGYTISLTSGISSALNGLKGVSQSTYNGNVTATYTATYECHSNTNAKLNVDISSGTFSFNGSDAFEVFGSYSETSTVNAIIPSAIPGGGSHTGSMEEAIALLRTTVNNTFKQKLNETVGTHMVFTFNFTYEYEGTSYINTTATANLSFDVETLAIRVIGITLDNDHVVFRGDLCRDNVKNT